MNISYAQKQTSAQQKTSLSTASILDNSSQNEGLQRMADMANNAAQRAEAPRPNNTGMPDNLKAGIESLSGFSMDDVRVHYNSSKPATVQALAYTQGTDIHVAPGQEKCLPHEAWHVAQQMAGRVSPTTNINGMPVNDNAGLEHEADVMGEKAEEQRKPKGYSFQQSNQLSNIAQCFTLTEDGRILGDDIRDVEQFCREFDSSSITDPYFRKKTEKIKDVLQEMLEKGHQVVNFEGINNPCSIHEFIIKIEKQMSNAESQLKASLVNTKDYQTVEGEDLYLRKPKNGKSIYCKTEDEARNNAYTFAKNNFKANLPHFGKWKSWDECENREIVTHGARTKIRVANNGHKGKASCPVEHTIHDQKGNPKIHTGFPACGYELHGPEYIDVVKKINGKYYSRKARHFHAVKYNANSDATTGNLKLDPDDIYENINNEDNHFLIDPFTDT